MKVPASFVRLLRIFSSPEFVTILRNISSGAAQGICRELFSRESDNKKKSSTLKGNNERFSSLVKLLEVFTTPKGEQLVSLVISTTVKEGLSAVFERYDRETAYALKKRRNGDIRIAEGHNKDKEQTEDIPPIVKALLDMALSDEGRKFMIDLVVAVTATAVPLTLKSLQKHSMYPTEKVQVAHKVDSVSPISSNTKASENSVIVESVASPTKKKHEKSTSFILPFFRKLNTEDNSYAMNEKQTKYKEHQSSRGTSAPGFLDKAAKLFGKNDNRNLRQENELNSFMAQNPVTEETRIVESSQASFLEKLAQSFLKDHELVSIALASLLVLSTFRS